MSWPVFTNGATLNLILYKHEQGIEDTVRVANQVGTALAKAGLPARLPADDRILRLSYPNQIRYCGLYNYLPGHTIPWEAYTMAHIKLLGKTMSDMHHTLQTGDIAAPDITIVLRAQVQRMNTYFAGLGVQRAMREKLNIAEFSRVFTSFHALLNTLQSAPGQQPLHMDFVRGNILFDGVGQSLQISGILDFEKAAIGHPVFDVARTLAFLLVDCKYKTEDQVRKYFLISGYQKRGAHPLQLPTISGASVLEALVNLFLLIDLYKFMLHNPYESLADNEHYVRTRDLLLKRNVIIPVV